MKRYGIGGWETRPHRVRLRAGTTIWEAPVAIWKLGMWRAPLAGGGYFRLLPLFFLRKAIRSMLAELQPVIIYCHPYEFNPGELEDYRGRVSGRLLFTQGLGRSTFVRRVRRLLREFPFGRFDEALAGLGIG